MKNLIITIGILLSTLSNNVYAQKFDSLQVLFTQKVNEERQKLGLGTLILDSEINKPAVFHVNYLKTNPLSHSESDKRYETAPLRGKNLTNKKHYVKSEVIHEYRTYGADIDLSNEELVNQGVARLMNSLGHKVIMTSQDIKYIGVGVLKEKRRFIVVMVFAYDFPYPSN
jgi:uncharacterized protein YkwD